MHKDFYSSKESLLKINTKLYSLIKLIPIVKCSKWIQLSMTSYLYSPCIRAENVVLYVNLKKKNIEWLT